MVMNISFNVGNLGYTGINSKQYEAAAKDYLAYHHMEVLKCHHRKGRCMSCLVENRLI